MHRRDVLKGIGLAAGSLMAPSWARAWPNHPQPADPAPLATPIRGLTRQRGQLMQPVTINLRPSAQAREVVVEINGREMGRRSLPAGAGAFDVYVSPVTSVQQHAVSVRVGTSVQHAAIELHPVRRMEIYILAHSHHDLGFTERQSDVEEWQMQNITRGIELAQRTAHYPEGSRFVWNLEVLWGADMYMQRRSPADRQALIEAVRTGHIALNGAYGNELTGLCRPEELLQLFRFGSKLGRQCGRPINAAMLSDVPGYTWGTVNAMAQAGIRYFSAAPNYFDRIGRFMETWQDKPCWWQSRSGREKVLFWVPWTGYAMSNIMTADTAWVGKYQERMDTVSFPYDISYVRWAGEGDNSPPDPRIVDFVRDWNARYEWPRFTFSSTSNAFAAFEQSHGDALPTYRGDLTPYWEDGSGSSARQTAMNRASADRLTQAAALAAIGSSEAYSVPRFDRAWRNVLLYSEHTWGSGGSIGDPNSAMTFAQWDVKRAFATDGDTQSSELLADALHEQATISDNDTVDIRNTNSWPRGGLVLLDKDLSAATDRVSDVDGNPVPSQRLASGDLAVWLAPMPAFGSQRLRLSAGTAHAGVARVSTATDRIENDYLRVRVDRHTGDIVELRRHGETANLVEHAQSADLNTFLFLSGDDVAQLQRSGPAKIELEDAGPLVATLKIESSAPGCESLLRRLRLAAGQDHVELLNTVVKARAPFRESIDKTGKTHREVAKESIQFAFPLAVADARMTVDLSFAQMDPRKDQLPGANHNWITVGRWVDVSGPRGGVTWVTLDAPLIEIGGITADLINSQTDPEAWLKQLKPGHLFYSWVMNNHWGTNYRAWQEGPVTFRYALRPHAGALDGADASRFAIGLSQPLLAVAASTQPLPPPPLRIEPPEVLVQAIKPSDDGKAWIVHLFGASGEAKKATLHWRDSVGATWLSNLAEEPTRKLDGPIDVAGWDLVILRVEQA
ncbi:MAG: hypothetical protein ABI767_09880 [Rhodanobacter sp.]